MCGPPFRIPYTPRCVSDLFLEKVVTKNRQFFDGLDKVVEDFLIAVDDVLHLLRPRHPTCTTQPLA